MAALSGMMVNEKMLVMSLSSNCVERLMGDFFSTDVLFDCP